MNNYTLVVIPDIEPENPLLWDNLGTFVSFDTRVTGPDEMPSYYPESYLIRLVDLCEDGFQERADNNFYGDNLQAVIDERLEKHYIMLPVYKYEHSGVVYNTTGFSCPWDSGQIGYIYASRESVRKEFSWKRITSKRQAFIEKILADEINTYSQWANGDVWGFQLYKHGTEQAYSEGEMRDSCWGFYSDFVPDTLDKLKECGIADHLPEECFNESLNIEVNFN